MDSAEMAAQSAPVPGSVHRIHPEPIPDADDEVLLSGLGKLVRIVGVVVAVAGIVLAIGLLADATHTTAAPILSDIIHVAANPLVAVALGIVATALLQSSTATTTITVTAVGAGVLPLSTAVPFIMGANLGTTVTAMGVAYTLINKEKEFVPGFATALTHTLFNLLCLLILLPLELLAHPLEKAASASATFLLGTNHTIPTAPRVEALTAPIVNALGTNGLLSELCGGQTSLAATCTGILAITLMTTSVLLMRTQLRTLMAATRKALLEHSALHSDTLGLTTGTTLAALIHSSTAVTTSLIPLASTTTFHVRTLLPVTLGANLGTTITALMATLAIDSPLGEYTLAAALMHVYINATGVITFLTIRPLLDATTTLCTSIAKAAAGKAKVTLAALVTAYALTPLAIIISAL